MLTPTIQTLTDISAIGNKKRVFYYPNTGNAGDSLINMGFYSIAEKIGLKYESISMRNSVDITDGDIVIIGGGGAIVPEWDSTSRFLAKISEKKIRIIILPQSIRGRDDIISNLPKDSVIICRERYSFDYCTNLAPLAKILLDDDMAFYADKAKILASSTTSPDKTIKNCIRAVAFYYHRIRSKFSSTILAFRCDKEQNTAIKVKRRPLHDFSSIARLGGGDEEAALRASKRFLQLINLYEVVHTDRLHVSIAASLLGKEVIIYNNSYFKCRGVFEQSIKGRFNARMADE